MIKDDQIDAFGDDGLMQFIGFPAADKKLGIWASPPAGQHNNRLGACGSGKQSQLFETGLEIGFAEIDVDECCACQIVSSDRRQRAERAPRGKLIGTLLIAR